MISLTPCDCGYGPGYYHTGPYCRHELNPGKPIETATAKLEIDRQPIAKFYGALTSDHAEAWALVGGTKHHKNFSYAKHGGRAGAFTAAARWIDSLNTQADIFGQQES